MSIFRRILEAFPFCLIDREKNNNNIIIFLDNFYKFIEKVHEMSHWTIWRMCGVSFNSKYRK